MRRFPLASSQLEKATTNCGVWIPTGGRGASVNSPALGTITRVWATRQSPVGAKRWPPMKRALCYWRSPLTAPPRAQRAQRTARPRRQRPLRRPPLLSHQTPLHPPRPLLHPCPRTPPPHTTTQALTHAAHRPPEEVRIFLPLGQWEESLNRRKVQNPST